MNFLKKIFIALAAAVLFSIFCITGLFSTTENRVYDFFLRFRRDRQRIDNLVFLDVDDNAIAYNGVFPWPRSVTADGLLRLKEYGAVSAIFDIEFQDKSPEGIDTVYLNQGLAPDFSRSFGGINSAAQDIFSALKAGRLGLSDLDGYSLALSELVREEQETLYSKARGIARDNDLYLAQASALFGKSWSTLNLRSVPLTGEQAERRSIAEQRFSYPVKASSDANRGNFIDILPALPSFSLAAKGSGFTNVEIDEDGIRRRVYLTQNIYDHWYLQLAFAPLVDYLGRPDIELNRNSMVLKNVLLPGSQRKDIFIPLDKQGRLMLDWPKENYQDSYSHISFAEFSVLETLETELALYSAALAEANIPFFSQYDPALSRLPVIISRLTGLLDSVPDAKNRALENCSEESFLEYTGYRAQSRDLIQEIIELGTAGRITDLAEDLSDAYPSSSDAIRSEAVYISTLIEYLQADLEKYRELSALITNAVKDKFCVLGRVDTGTTDIGANPFWGDYINVGTHGVVLDMILQESFITPLDIRWSILFTLIFVPLFFFLTVNLPPLPRAALGLGVTFLVALASILLLRFSGFFFSPLGTVLALLSAVIVREIVSYAGSEQEKQFIRKAFSTYVSSDVVKELISDPSRLQLGGAKRHMSAIFTDIRGFSTISEQLDPEDLVSLLNRYLTAMSDVVLAEKGTIDKYEGDAIIAFFGAPLSISDHALRACISAVTMKRIEGEMNRKIIEEKLSPSPLLTRIGVNSGSMVAGNMGTSEKMNYTIMGNAVNLAARLEGVNKQYGTWILASEDTVKETEGRILTRRLDRVRVVGINEPVRLYELLETTENARSEQKKLVEVFHEALDYFENRDWKKAVEGFGEALNIEIEIAHGQVTGIGPSKKYLERCEAFLDTPPQDNWDGVYSLTEK